MARSSRRAHSRQKKEYLWAIVLLVAVLTIVGAVAYNMMHREKGLDRDSLCPAQGPSGHYVLLVDKTDPLTFTQKQTFNVLLQDLVEKQVPPGYLLSVFVLGEDFKETASPIIELCNPGDGSDKSELTSNVRKLKAQYRSRFIEPMLKQSEDLVSTTSAKWSPIFEMLQLVSINGFRKHGVNGEHRLIIMSDMLHNTPQFSMYKSAADFSLFFQSDYAKNTQLDLHNTEVELHYLMNSPQLQTNRNLHFWEEYFAKTGARIVSVNPM
jgi:hypothetical protein